MKTGALINRINGLVGRTFRRFGYRFDLAYRYPSADLNILRLGILFLGGKEKRPLRLVQIGAYDGRVSDPIDGLLEIPNISSIIVEPQPVPFQVLNDRYQGLENVYLEQSMIGSVDGTSTLYLPESTVHSQLASSDRRHLHKLGYADASIKKLTVHSMTPASLLKKYNFESVDALQIDAEGADCSILAQFFAMGIEPGVINLETFHVAADERLELYSQLRARGYDYVDHDLDTFCIKRELLKV